MAAFDPEATKVMGEAFDGACKVLHVRGELLVVREFIARQIINAAKHGERDPVRLCAVALAAMARRDDQAMKQQGPEARRPGAF